jgi:hypothetical protein
MLTATIIRMKKSGRIYVRIALGNNPADKGGDPDDVEVLEKLQGYDRRELKERAEKYVREVIGGTVG